MVDLSGPALLDMVSQPTREWMAGLATRRSYSDGELVHAPGDSDVTMEVIISGSIRLVQIRHDGSQSYLSTIGPGQHIADIVVLAGVPRTHSAYAVGNVTIDHYDRASLGKLIENHEVLRALYEVNGNRLGTALTMVDDLRTLSREAHLVKLLLTLTAKSDPGSSIAAIQEDLASILGVSAMTLAKSLALLKRERLIETGYRQVRVIDRERLSQWFTAKEPE